MGPKSFTFLLSLIACEVACFVFMQEAYCITSDIYNKGYQTRVKLTGINDQDFTNNSQTLYDAESSITNTREARKIFPFNLLSKPKVSKLYLVNGTLCRFVGFAPVCTTLSTTPLLRKFAHV